MLSKIFSLKNIAFTSVIIILAILLAQVDSCYSKRFADQQVKYDSVILANQALYQTVNKQGQTITKQEAIITSTQSDIKARTEELFDLKKKDEKRIKQINALIQTKTKTSVTNTKIPYLDSNKMKTFTDSVERACADVIAYYRKNALELTDTSGGEPAKNIKIDSTQNKDFQIDASVLKDSFKINSIVFPDSQRIAILETKGGLFRRDIKGKVRLWTKPKLEIMVLHTNKYIKVEGMSTLVYTQKAKGRWVERLLIFGAGVAVDRLILSR